MRYSFTPSKGLLCLLLGLSLHFSIYAQNGIVGRYGQLSVKGRYIMSQYGDTVQLRGMSLFWSQWMAQYYDTATIKWLANDWKCTVVRAAMGVDMGGYMENPGQEKEKVKTVVDAAIESGIYVIIDYHSHEAHKKPETAKAFFAEMAKRYGKYPNVLYEIYNEPLQDTYWNKDLKPYAEEVIKSIREYDPDNIVIVGTRVWSQMVSEAAENPLADPNVAYTLHFYAASHGQQLRDEAKKALDKGVALFVSEFGTCEYTGDGELGVSQTRDWFDFLDNNKISWCNWSVANKKETASILKPDCHSVAYWEETDLTPSGIFIRKEIRQKNIPLLNKRRAPKPKTKKPKASKK